MNVNLLPLFILLAVSAPAQTNQVTATYRQVVISQPPSQQTNQTLSVAEQVEQIRAACILGRRSICGKILKVLPDGLVIESGYTNLLRSPLDRSWLVPGTVTASRAPNFVEGNEPDAVCAGLVFLSDIPKPRLAKAKQYDYVIVQGFPAGKHTYMSVGDTQRTIRRFSYKLEAAVQFHLKAGEEKAPATTEEK
jgi:hypothetical protein